MTNFSIGLSGFETAQRAIDIIGNNIANSSTEGYHRQRLDLTTAYSTGNQLGLLGGGVEIKSVTRMIDNLLEQELLQERSLLEHTLQEYTTLGTIESVLGELGIGDSGLNSAIDGFFNALRELGKNPGDFIWQKQVVSAAETMSHKFGVLGDFLTDLQSRIQLEAEINIENVNQLITQIAGLNGQIENIEIGGTNANNLKDQRDQCITELAKLIPIDTISRNFGVVDVTAMDSPVVTGVTAMELEAGLDANGKLGITVVGLSVYTTDFVGGRLGGLVSLRNEIISDIHTDLNSLALTIIQQINQYHFQGVGSAGSFTELTGWSMVDETLANFELPVSDGSFYIRVTNTSTGQITRNKIDVDESSDTLSTIAASISSVTGLSAAVISSKLKITADANYKFDFLPAVLPEPEAGDIDFNGTTDPTVALSGIYTGTSNDTLTFTVSGTGEIGVDNLTLTVTDLAANTIATINIGSGYAAGDVIEVGDTGIKIFLSTGDLADGDSFSIDVFANTDTSGLLAAIGMNTFFSGTNASTIAVCSDISDSPARVAASLGADTNDNTNAMRMATLEDTDLTALNSMTPGEFYRQLVMGVGQKLSIKQMSKDNLEGIVQNLLNRQSEISGVNINEEAAQLLVFEQMFQAMAKYMSILQSTLSDIMEIL